VTDPGLIAALRHLAGDMHVLLDDDALALAASDVHETGALPLAVVRPQSVDTLAACVGAATSHGYAIAPRGGGLSYTAGYIPAGPRTISVDLSGLNRIVAISEADMTITVEAGVTWKQIQDALRPLGRRLPFFGTFSGKGATVGGGLSHGALFFGSARYGSAAEMVLGLDVVCADGLVLRTGQGALMANSKPFIRSFGPDLTGLFVHDGGTLGVKARATLRLINAPAHEDFASFSFPRIEDASAALSAIAREDLADDVYILDPASTDQIDLSTADMVRSASAVARRAKNLLQALKSLTSMATAGTRFIPEGHYSLHVTAAGRSEAAVLADLNRARILVAKSGGVEVAGTIPRVARADLFANLNGVIGPKGGRWAALNAKVAHSDGERLIAAFDEMIAPHRGTMTDHGVSFTRLASALSNHCFSFEPVFHWQDSWLPIHRAVADPAHLRQYNEPPPNPEGRALVDQLRRETVNLFRDFGAASNQIGRVYPYFSALAPEPASLLLAVKRHLDPRGLMNPGVLEFPSPNTKD
jgi:FAD/FMN-containing dehydrogenase